MGEENEVLPPKPPECELEEAKPEAGVKRRGSGVNVGEGREVEVIKLMPTTKEDMTELTGINN